MATLPPNSQGPSTAAREGAVVLILLSAIGWLILLLLLGFIVPRFAEIFTKFKIEGGLPVSTQILCSTGLVVQQFWYLFGLGWLCVAGGMVLWVLKGRWKHRALVVSLLGAGSLLGAPVILGAIVISLFCPLVELIKKVNQG